MNTLHKAATIVVENQNATAPFLFTELGVSYKEVLELIKELEKVGVLGTYVEGQKREIIIQNTDDLVSIFPDINDKKSNAEDDNNTPDSESKNDVAPVTKPDKKEINKKEPKVSKPKSVAATSTSSKKGHSFYKFFFFIFLLSLSGLSYMFYDLYEEYHDLEFYYYEYEDELFELEESNEDYESRINTLIENKRQSDNEINQLKRDVRSLESENSDLEWYRNYYYNRY